jgi:hypothetical protein
MLTPNLLSNRQSTVLKELRLLQKTCEAEQLNQKARLDSIFSSVEAVNHMAKSLLKNAEDLAQVNAVLPQIGENSDKIRREQEIITSLNYRPRKFRYQAIEDAHTKTFKWVYKPPHDQFLQWLKSGNGIFWLSGKPGSGKSTLMKFIVDNPRTSQALATWANGKRCVTASHFFWIAGETIQMSQEGLFRSLLYTVFKERPQLVETLCPSLWKASREVDASESEFDQIWSRRALREAILRLKDFQDDESLFCFFIDGLDEYEGDHLEMVRMLESFVMPGNIKICVSSRPWNVFSDAFGRAPRRTVALHDLTHKDFALFVQDKLGEHHLWESLSADVRHQISHEILQKAEGVFLWVHLVVKKIREGLSNGDTIEVLQQRVRSFPPDLEEFFSRMMESIDPLYLSHSARAFQVALHTTWPLPTLLYSFLDDEAENEQYAVRLPMQQFDEDALKIRIEQVPKRLEARCKGLLEVITSDKALYGEECLQPRVEFIHRTARDFIQTRQIIDLLNEGAKGFKPYTSILRAYLAGLKVLKTKPRRSVLKTARSDESLRDMLLDAFSYAHAAEEKQNPVDYTVLDEFSATFDRIRTLEHGVLPCVDRLVTGFLGTLHSGQPTTLIYHPGAEPNPFHILILQSGLTKYFSQLEGLQYTAHGASLLLVCIVHLHCQHPELGIDIRSSILAILDKGADLNQKLVGQSTAWVYILRALATARTRGPSIQGGEPAYELESQSPKDKILRQNFSTIARLLERGADPNVHCGEGYPLWLDILNSNMLCENRQMKDQDAVFGIIEAFIGAGAHVNSTPALQIWSQLLDMLLLPTGRTGAVTDMQITKLLVLAIDAGVDLDQTQIKDVTALTSPHVSSKINTAWARHCDRTSSTRARQATKLRSIISTDLGARMVIYGMYLVMTVLLLPHVFCHWLVESTLGKLGRCVYENTLGKLGRCVYENILQILHRISQRISRLVETMVAAFVLYLLSKGNDLAFRR